MTNHNQKYRVLGILLVILAAFVGLSWRLAYLQVVKHDEFAERADDAHLRTQIIPARRGDIRDRNGALLATSIPVKTVFLDAKTWSERRPSSEARQRLVQLLSLDSRWLDEKIATNKRYIVLARKVSMETTDALRGLKIHALGYEDDFLRRYPLDRSLCHTLGFVDFDGIGTQGIERTYDVYLAGQAGWRIAPRDNRGREIVAWRQEEVPARDGYTVELTIDHVIQDIVEAELAEQVKLSQPLNACAIVMHPRTGEVLAMASYPTFNPNKPSADPIEHQKNIPIVNTFEPGSTFKIVPVAGALNDNLVKPGDVFNCHNGSFTYAGKVLRDAHPHGNLAVWQIIQKSSNIGAALIGLKMGDHRLYHYIEAFGFGSRTGLDLPAEVRGIVNPVQRWSKLEITRIPMGQSIAVTPMQMIRDMAAMSNGGELMQPYIVRRIRSKDATTIAEFFPRLIARPVSARTSAQMNAALKSVVSDEGTAKKAMLADWEVAGKTGTAQKYENGQPSHTKFIGSFIGYLPADDPKLCILVVLDEPKGAYYGGDIAAPVFRRIAERSAAYLNIPPRPTAAKTKRIASAQPSRTNATRRTN